MHTAQLHLLGNQRPRPAGVRSLQTLCAGEFLLLRGLDRGCASQEALHLRVVEGHDIYSSMLQRKPTREGVLCRLCAFHLRLTSSFRPHFLSLRQLSLELLDFLLLFAVQPIALLLLLLRNGGSGAHLLALLALVEEVVEENSLEVMLFTPEAHI